MKLTCRIVERRLAVLAVRSDCSDDVRDLPAHLQKCASCRTAWAELRGLRPGIGQAIPLVETDVDFVRAVAAKISTLEPTPVTRLSPLFGAVGAACAIALLIFGSRYLRAGAVDVPPLKDAGVSRAHGPVQPQPSPDMAARNTNATVAPLSHATTKRPKAAKRRRQRRGTPIVPAAGRTYLVKGSPKKAPDKLTWATVGLYLEYAGDYRRASAAYAMAYKQKADPQIAYAAARSAESAGDVTNALNYYATVLDTSPPQKH